MKNLNQTKESFIKSMRDMLERDSKIDVCMEKTEQINVSARALKKKATTVNTNMRRRNYCLKIVGPIIILVLVGLLIWWIVNKFSN